MGETEWAQFHRISTRGAWHEVVENAGDLDVTVGTGTRGISVSAGNIAVCGVLVKSDAVVNLNLAAQSVNPRITTIALQIDWSGTVDTAATIIAINGATAASPVAPTLTRVAGTTWQVALARVTVAASATTFVAGNIEKATPQRRREYHYQQAIDQATITGSQVTQVSRIADRDPGWPYKLRLESYCDFASVTAGSAIITGNVDGAALTSGVAGGKNDAPAHMRPAISGTRTGQGFITTLTAQRGPAMVDPLITSPTRSGFIVTVIPD
jgi:hypothetical protein